MEIALRPVEQEDAAFLRRLYADIRAGELAPVPWSDDQKAMFLEQQFVAQDRSYHENHPDASFSVITKDGEPIGRVYLSRLPDDELRIIDIALLSEHCGAGIGTALIRDVLADADRDGLMVSLHVEQWNPALRLYQRLGFVRAGENDIYVLMELPRTDPT